MTASIRQPSFLLVLILPLACHAVPLQESTLPVDGTDLGKQFREFAALKQEEVRGAAQAKGIDVPTEVDHFFAAVRSKEWSRAESLYLAFKSGTRSEGDNDALALSTGMHDVSGVYDLMDDWGDQLATLYTDEALRSIPSGSIVFGGTSEGRFFISYGAETLRKGKVTVVTQNALADNTYVDYLRYALGKRMSIFPVEDSTKAFQEYVEDVKAGRKDSKGALSFKDGRAQITGARAVMDINGILARRLVELNQNTHPFYVEESYVINWMYEYLTPHGLIMKLNKLPLASLSPGTVNADQEYWQSLESKLNSIPVFSGTDAARKAFSKCRCAIAGLYAHHGMNEQARSAFRQAIRLCPTSPEANFRLAGFLKGNGEHVQAEAVLTEYMKTSPTADQVTRISRCLEELRQQKNDDDSSSSAAPR